MQLAVPAEVGRSLPEVAEWDLVVAADGLLFRFVGKAEKKKGGRTRTVALPFLDGKEAGR